MINLDENLLVILNVKQLFSHNMSPAKKFQSTQPIHGVTIIQRLEQYHLGKEAFYEG